MKYQHSPFHWIAVALVTAVALLTLNEAWGQSTGSAAVFEGRPAMAGAQAGQGAMAGPPQGGISPQGSDGVPSVPRDPGMKPVTPVNDRSVLPQRDRDDASVTKQNRAAKAKRSAKRSLERARRGNTPVDSSAN